LYFASQCRTLGAGDTRVRRDERLGGVRDVRRRVVRPEHPGGHPGTVHNEEELAREYARFAQAGLRGEIREALAHPLFVGERYAVGRMTRVGKLGRRNLERATPALGARRQLCERLEDREQLGALGTPMLNFRIVQ